MLLLLSAWERAAQNFPVYVFAEEKVKATEGLSGNGGGWVTISSGGGGELVVLSHQNLPAKKDFYEGWMRKHTYSPASP